MLLDETCASKCSLNLHSFPCTREQCQLNSKNPFFMLGLDIFLIFCYSPRYSNVTEWEGQSWTPRKLTNHWILSYFIFEIQYYDIFTVLLQRMVI